MDKLERIREIYKDADQNWNHGYALISYLEENGDLCESRVDYSTVVGYTKDMISMLDAIKEIISEEE